jgi:hypothetical protein
MMYFFHKNTEHDRIYHWHRECDRMPTGASLPENWQRSNRIPEDRDRCSRCDELDDKNAQERGPHSERQTVSDLKRQRLH